MELVWKHPGLAPKQVHAAIVGQRKISVNTVQSTLDRLYKKQFLSREKQGHAYHYSAVVDRDQLVGDMISDVMGRFQLDGVASVAAFVQAAGSLKEADLARLEDEIRARREAGEKR